MVRSAGVWAKAYRARAVVISKKLMGWPWLAASTSSMRWESSSSVIKVPAMRMRSAKRTRWGEMITWTFRPAASAMARR